MNVEEKVLVALKEAYALLVEQEKRPEELVVRRDELDVREIRRKLDMTQQKFAVVFSFPLKSLQNWEQGHRQPDAAARGYLKVIANEPEAVLRALGKFPTSNPDVVVKNKPGAVVRPVGKASTSDPGVVVISGGCMAPYTVHRKLVTNYGRHIRERVLCNTPNTNDAKTLKKYQRQLRDESTLTIFEILWKESEWVSDAELKDVELRRQFNGAGFTLHDLAVKLSDDENDDEEVTENENVIQAVGRAGAAYHLIERDERTPNKVILRATSFLDKFMRDLSVENSRVRLRQDI